MDENAAITPPGNAGITKTVRLPFREDFHMGKVYTARVKEVVSATKAVLDFGSTSVKAQTTAFLVPNENLSLKVISTAGEIKLEILSESIEKPSLENQEPLTKVLEKMHIHDSAANRQIAQSMLVEKLALDAKTFRLIEGFVVRSELPADVTARACAYAIKKGIPLTREFVEGLSQIILDTEVLERTTAAPELSGVPSFFRTGVDAVKQEIAAHSSGFINSNILKAQLDEYFAFAANNYPDTLSGELLNAYLAQSAAMLANIEREIAESMKLYLDNNTILRNVDILIDKIDALLSSTGAAPVSAADIESRLAFLMLLMLAEPTQYGRQYDNLKALVENIDKNVLQTFQKTAAQMFNYFSQKALPDLLADGMSKLDFIFKSISGNPDLLLYDAERLIEDSFVPFENQVRQFVSSYEVLLEKLGLLHKIIMAVENKTGALSEITNSVILPDFAARLDQFLARITELVSQVGTSSEVTETAEYTTMASYLTQLSQVMAQAKEALQNLTTSILIDELALTNVRFDKNGTTGTPVEGPDINQLAEKYEVMKDMLERLPNSFKATTTQLLKSLEFFNNRELAELKTVFMGIERRELENLPMIDHYRDVFARIRFLMTRTLTLQMLNLNMHEDFYNNFYAEFLARMKGQPVPVRLRFRLAKEGRDTEKRDSADIAFNLTMSNIGNVRARARLDNLKGEKNARISIRLDDETVQRHFDENELELREKLQEIGFASSVETAVRRKDSVEPFLSDRNTELEGIFGLDIWV